MKFRTLSAATAIIAATALAGCAPQQFVTLRDLLGTEPLAGITNPHEATDVVCKSLDGCVEGWVSGEAEFSRFGSTDAAEDYADLLGEDAFRSNFLVIHWTSQIDPAHRRWLEERFEGAHQSQ